MGSTVSVTITFPEIGGAPITYPSVENKPLTSNDSANGLQFGDSVRINQIDIEGNALHIPISEGQSFSFGNSPDAFSATLYAGFDNKKLAPTSKIFPFVVTTDDGTAGFNMTIAVSEPSNGSPAISSLIFNALGSGQLFGFSSGSNTLTVGSGAAVNIGSGSSAVTVPFPVSSNSPVRAQQVLYEESILSPSQIPANAKRDILTVNNDTTVSFSASAQAGYAYYFTLVSNPGSDDFILSSPSGNWFINGVDSGSTTYSDIPLNVQHTVLYDGTRWNILQEDSGALPIAATVGARPANVPVGGKWLDPDITNDPLIRIRRA